VKKTVEEWKRDLKGKPVEAANELIVVDGTDEAYEAFAVLYASTPRGLQAKDWLDRHRRMVAWNNAVIINTAAGYRAFILQYPDSDLVATARKLEERLRFRPNLAPVVAANASLPVQNAALGPMCPCNNQPAVPPQQQKVNAPVKKVDPDPPKRTDRKPPKRVREPDDDVVVVRRAPPQYYEPAPGPSIGIGIGIGGGSYGGGSYGGGGHYGGQRRGY